MIFAIHDSYSLFALASIFIMQGVEYGWREVASALTFPQFFALVFRIETNSLEFLIFPFSRYEL